jgi:7-carboxy-7-deazaguanine synthase
LSDLRIKLNEVFHSLQGESTLAGLPTVFVRFQGCNLSCGYCDTPRARGTGTGHGTAVEELVALIEGKGCPLVCLTGGEPLMQREGLASLARRLLGSDYSVSLETNGSLPIAGLPPGLRRVMDLKTPGSGMADQNLEENLDLLGQGDELKCVVTCREDFQWAIDRVRNADLPGRIPVLFSPAAGHLEPAELAHWILSSGLPVRLQLQLHRLVWPDGRDGDPMDPSGEGD